MRWLFVLLLTCLLAVEVQATEGRVIKVLPQFLDKKGKSTVSPSLYDRDAYQSYLLHHPKDCTGLRFAVQWKAKASGGGPLKLRVEIRGIAKGDLPKEDKIELEVHQRHWFSHWAVVSLTGEQYKAFGSVTAWRTTLWDGNELLSEQKSFLW